MSITAITPQAARQLLDDGAVLIDIRSPDEYAREHIAAARSIPMEQLSGPAPALEKASVVIFHCRSGKRTQLNAPKLSNCASCDLYILEGGLDAWKQAGLPVVADRSQPLELMRQVQIVAGSLILLGTVLAALVSPWWLLLTGFVGTGLIFAGVTGFCGMAHLLMRMPWNKTVVG